MKVVFAGEALADLDGILSFIASNYPAIQKSDEAANPARLPQVGHLPSMEHRPSFETLRGQNFWQLDIVAIHWSS